MSKVPVATALLAASLFGQTPDSATAPVAERILPLELGGFFTLDLAAPASQWPHGEVPLSLSWMELSARTQVSPSVTGAVTLLSRDGTNQLEVWQCLAAWQRDQASLTVGRQNFHHGLLNARIISGALFWDDAWRNANGAEASWTQASWAAGLGAASIPIDADPEQGVSAHSEASASGFANWTPREGSIVQLAGVVGAESNDAYLGANLTAGSFLLDAEGYRKFNSTQADLVGWDASLGCQLGSWTLNTRYDRLSRDAGTQWEGRATAGLAVQFLDALFAGGELSRSDDGKLAIGFQVGMSSHLKVPGHTPQQLGR